MDISQLLSTLKTKRHILLLTTSNRWIGESAPLPKSTMFAQSIARKFSEKTTLLNIPELTIYPCEGNVSSKEGNTCGLKESILQDQEKNPSGQHRCWASINNSDDELWKVSKALLASDCVMFFGSVRWGQMNSFYQKLIERLTWLENRHSTLGEENILSHISAGIFVTGHNWRAKEVMQIQKEVLSYFGFEVEDELCGYWSMTEEASDESPELYARAFPTFEEKILSHIKK